MKKPTRWIIDDFLPEDELEVMENGLYHSDFPWKTLYGVVNRYDGEKRMVHSLYKEPIRSDYFDKFEPIYRELNLMYVLTAKINLDFKQDKTYEFHTDSPIFNEFNPVLFTGIFNFTDCNGGTKFEKDGKFIKSKRNRMVIFSSCLRHAGVCPTDEFFRHGLNINWVGEKPVRGITI
tara:strand:+ start:203 stop:733 length:531 start_codon:yes stop_codon:yes gene_type:complete